LQRWMRQAQANSQTDHGFQASSGWFRKLQRWTQSKSIYTGLPVVSGDCKKGRDRQAGFILIGGPEIIRSRRCPRPAKETLILRGVIDMTEKEITAAIKQDIDLRDYIESRGIPLEKAGKAYIGRCPFHEDIKKSLSVNPIWLTVVKKKIVLLSFF
jgi:hypothetical protein